MESSWSFCRLGWTEDKLPRGFALAFLDRRHRIDGCSVGFSYLAFTQSSGVEAALILSAFGFVRSAQGTASYAMSKPAKELLFTLVTREPKYQTKNFIDTALHRGGNTLSI